MKKIFLIGLFTIVFTILFSPAVLAQSKPKSMIKLPVFMAGDNQTVDKPIDGDLMISGGQIKTNSSIDGDAYVAGGQIDIGGTITGNLIVAGGNITISGKVMKNVIVAGGQVKIDSTAEIGGYVLAGGGQVDLLGNFLGPVKVGAKSLVVGEKATINGNLEADVSKSDVSSNSKIVGEKKIVIHEMKQPEKQQANQWKKMGYVKEIFSFLSKLIVLLILVKLFGEKIKQNKTINTFWSTIGLGLIILVVAPILSLILMGTIIAIPLSLIISVFYFVSLYLSGIVASILVGDFIFEKGYLKTGNNYFQSILGLVLITLLGLIPFVGGLIKFIVLLLGLGFIFKSLTLKKNY